MKKALDQAVSKRLDTQFSKNDYSRSRVTIYWLNRKFDDLSSDVRPRAEKIIPPNYPLFDQSSVIEYWKLKGLEYGNWLSQEDKYNYFLACQLALFDLDRVLNFGHNLGFNYTIGIAFGARGRGSALAHFETDTEMINITRYREAEKGALLFQTTGALKKPLFLNSGGMGSFGHEYAHALDFVFGKYVDLDHLYGKHQSLTYAISTSDKFPNKYPKNSMRYDALKIIESLIWKKSGGYTSFYAPLRELYDKKKINDYLIRHCEMFARSFEIYLSIKLKKLGINNRMLIKNKYDANGAMKLIYPNAVTMRTVIPYWDSLIKKMSNHVRNT